MKNENKMIAHKGWKDAAYNQIKRILFAKYHFFTYTLNIKRKSIRLHKYLRVPFTVTSRKTMLQAIMQLQEEM